MSALRDALRELPDAVFADLLESDGEYLLVLDMPGVTEETIDIDVTNGRLQIEARREKDVPIEFDYLSEERPLFLDAELPLPPDATGSGAEATVSRGVLEITLPKRTSAPEESVPVTSR
ncbi:MULTISPECIES: Hsp20/alpha crystallin family protein [unclassified Haladaptatus]|uniref:Hsp20/alpha crystallin family protein n=1 Tax=unclassified Haladaptatus TaxID=2622732 RepID=UPI0007B48E3F|nr:MULTISPECIES: Hsp20/alpha crystallin family protein [unclassified Haladaptatus]KZN23506.1 molecular chaperone Hsp20 [Haladaptatus sp. R4]MCO8245146.1 Hsp20/alpha crystallin family protein [Haladaptatus sp. AB643]MCO8253289.1 Hsp20/alpha crystallin family protein [Haladaptatus sp. AB618]